MGRLGNIEHTLEIGDRTLRFEGGKIAPQAGGAVIASLGDTTILTTTTSSSQTKEFLGFFPLTVDVEERMYAAGKIPGGFFKREGRPSENAVLTCRLIDRPLRPTFQEGMRNEVQIINTILQTGQVDPYDVVAINASSISTMLAGIPFDGPVAGVRYAMMKDGSWTAFPTYEELDTDAVFQMVVAGRVNDAGEIGILMVEADATPQAVELIDAGAQQPTEDVIGKALEDVKSILREICDAQQAFVDEVGVREAGEFKIFTDYDDTILEVVDTFAADKLREVYLSAAKKQEQLERIGEIREEAVAHLKENGPADLEPDERAKQAKQAFRTVEKKIVRALITEEGRRVDGRGTRDIRPLSAEVGVLNRVHGSSIFQRGETQVMNILALGMLRDAQRLDTLHPEDEKRYMHHYNMPPYSTGETGRVGSPKRREVGHGLLAERALLPVIPNEEEWPYAMRLVSECVASNGSTSMASVCASSLSLMDGGVPIHAAVGGIAMGLIYENDKYTTLTDIQGVEDFFGDMDFKVAGTREFVTALQLDTKILGVPSEVLADALLQAREARMAILDVMIDAIAEPRPEVADSAPRVMQLVIPLDKVGEVIGPKGKVIREIVEDTGANIDVDDDGTRGIVRIYAADGSAAEAAADRINAIANPVVPKEGERFQGTVVKTVDFGAFVSLTPGVDGLLHISKIGQKAGRRLDHAEEALNVGDVVHVEVKEVRAGGKYSLDYVDTDGGGGSGDGGGGRSEDRSESPRKEREDRPARREGSGAGGGGERKRTRTRTRE